MKQQQNNRINNKTKKTPNTKQQNKDKTVTKKNKKTSQIKKYKTEPIYPTG